MSYLVQQVFRHLFIPGTILGMILLLIFLITKRIKKDDVEEVGTFLTNNMAFFFIPAAVSVMEYLSILQSTFLKIIIISIISLIISFFAVTYSVKLVIHLQSKAQANRGESHE